LLGEDESSTNLDYQDEEDLNVEENFS